jgi:hypothetical protein
MVWGGEEVCGKYGKFINLNSEILVKAQSSSRDVLEIKKKQKVQKSSKKSIEIKKNKKVVTKVPSKRIFTVIRML